MSVCLLEGGGDDAFQRGGGNGGGRGGGEQVTYTGKVVGWLVDPAWYFFSQATRRGQERICAMSREPGGNNPTETIATKEIISKKTIQKTGRLK